MKIVQETDFSNKNYKNMDLLGTYTASRDMLLHIRVDTTTSVVGQLQLWAKAANRWAGPINDTWQPSSANVLCNNKVFPLAVKSGQAVEIYVYSGSVNDISEDGTVYFAELDVPTEDLYTAVIERLRDDLASTAADEWSVLFCKNGVPQTSGVTNPKLSIYQRSDGAALFTDQALSAIGSTGAFKYDATGDERGTDGETLIAVASATIDSATRTYTEIIATDRIAVG